MAKEWINRIVGHGEEAPDQLLANPRNWRIHPQSQQVALSSVLDEVGYVDTVLVNQRTGFVIDGHLRVAMAISKGQRTIPVTYVDLSEEEEALVLATFDPLTALAVADREQLGELLRGIEVEDEVIKQMLTKLALDTGISKFDPMGEWQGLPAFENEAIDKNAVIVHFRNGEDRQAFASLIGQKITEQTRYIWFPLQERELAQFLPQVDEP